MEVISREDVDKLGTRGQVVKVAAGYARNSLLPKRRPLPPPKPTRRLSSRNARRICAARRRNPGCRRLAKMMSRRSDHDRPKGRRKRTALRVRHRERYRRTLEQQGYKSTGARSTSTEPIKTLGEFKVPIRLHREVPAEITVAAGVQRRRHSFDRCAWPEPEEDRCCKRRRRLPFLTVLW